MQNTGILLDLLTLFFLSRMNCLIVYLSAIIYLVVVILCVWCLVEVLHFCVELPRLRSGNFSFPVSRQMCSRSLKQNGICRLSEF